MIKYCLSFSLMDLGVEAYVMRSNKYGYKYTTSKSEALLFDSFDEAQNYNEKYHLGVFNVQVKIAWEKRKLLKIGNVRERMDAHYRGEISYSRAVELLNEDANKALHTGDNSDSLPPFEESIKLLRDLAELQNGPPLLRHEEEYHQTMAKVWKFLKEHESDD